MSEAGRAGAGDARAVENERVAPGDARRGEVEILREREVWGNDLVRLCVATVRFPPRGDDAPLEKEQFRLAHGPQADDGVVVAPVDPDGRVLLVRQFRHAPRMWLRELPRGYRERGEAPEDAARRELREEVGAEVEAIHPLGRVVTDGGKLYDAPYLFVARVRRGGEAHRERTEAIDRVVALPFAELRRQAQRGEIVDGFTLAAVARLEPHFDGARFAFRPEMAPPG